MKKYRKNTASFLLSIKKTFASRSGFAPIVVLAVIVVAAAAAVVPISQVVNRTQTGEIRQQAATPGCDNGVPIGGTACRAQGETVQFRCLDGSYPGASRWSQESCPAGQTCQGASCQGSSAPPPNNPPVPPPPTTTDLNKCYPAYPSSAGCIGKNIGDACLTGYACVRGVRQSNLQYACACVPSSSVPTPAPTSSGGGTFTCSGKPDGTQVPGAPVSVRCCGGAITNTTNGACPSAPTKKANGVACNADSECISNICIVNPLSGAKQCSATRPPPTSSCANTGYPYTSESLCRAAGNTRCESRVFGTQPAVYTCWRAVTATVPPRATIPPPVVADCAVSNSVQCYPVSSCTGNVGAPISGRCSDGRVCCRLNTSLPTPRPTPQTLTTCGTCFNRNGCVCPANCNFVGFAANGGSCQGIRPTPRPTRQPLSSCNSVCTNRNGCRCPVTCVNSGEIAYQASCGGGPTPTPAVVRCSSLSGTVVNTTNNTYCCNGIVKTGACSQSELGSSGDTCNTAANCRSGLICTNRRCANPTPRPVSCTQLTGTVIRTSPLTMCCAGFERSGSCLNDQLGGSGDTCNTAANCRSGLICTNRRCANPTPPPVACSQLPGTVIRTSPLTTCCGGFERIGSCSNNQLGVAGASCNTGANCRLGLICTNRRCANPTPAPIACSQISGTVLRTSPLVTCCAGFERTGTCLNDQLGGSGATCNTAANCRSGLICTNRRCANPTPAPITCSQISGSVLRTSPLTTCCAGFERSGSCLNDQLGGSGDTCNTAANCRSGLICTNRRCANPTPRPTRQPLSGCDSICTNRNGCTCTRACINSGEIAYQASCGGSTPRPTPTPRANGVPCTSDAQCESRICDTNPLSGSKQCAGARMPTCTASSGYPYGSQSLCLSAGGTRCESRTFPAPTGSLQANYTCWRPVSTSTTVTISAGQTCKNSAGCTCSATNQRLAVNGVCCTTATATRIACEQLNQQCEIRNGCWAPVPQGTPNPPSLLEACQSIGFNHTVRSACESIYGVGNCETRTLPAGTCYRGFSLPPDAAACSKPVYNNKSIEGTNGNVRCCSGEAVVTNGGVCPTAPPKLTINQGTQCTQANGCICSATSQAIASNAYCCSANTATRVACERNGDTCERQNGVGCWVPVSAPNVPTPSPRANGVPCTSDSQCASRICDTNPLSGTKQCAAVRLPSCSSSTGYPYTSESLCRAAGNTRCESRVFGTQPAVYTCWRAVTATVPPRATIPPPVVADCAVSNSVQCYPVSSCTGNVGAPISGRCSDGKVCCRLNTSLPTPRPTPRPTIPPPVVANCVAPNQCVPTSSCSGNVGTAVSGRCSQTGYTCCRLNVSTPRPTREPLSSCNSTCLNQNGCRCPVTCVNSGEIVYQAWCGGTVPSLSQGQRCTQANGCVCRETSQNIAQSIYCCSANTATRVACERNGDTCERQNGVGCWVPVSVPNVPTPSPTPKPNGATCILSSECASGICELNALIGIRTCVGQSQQGSCPGGMFATRSTCEGTYGAGRCTSENVRVSSTITLTCWKQSPPRCSGEFPFNSCIQTQQYDCVSNNVGCFKQVLRSQDSTQPNYCPPTHPTNYDCTDREANIVCDRISHYAPQIERTIDCWKVRSTTTTVPTPECTGKFNLKECQNSTERLCESDGKGCFRSIPVTQPGTDNLCPVDYPLNWNCTDQESGTVCESRQHFNLRARRLVTCWRIGVPREPAQQTPKVGDSCSQNNNTRVAIGSSGNPNLYCCTGVVKEGLCTNPTGIKSEANGFVCGTGVLGRAACILRCQNGYHQQGAEFVCGQRRLYKVVP